MKIDGAVASWESKSRDPMAFATIKASQIILLLCSPKLKETHEALYHFLIISETKPCAPWASSQCPAPGSWLRYMCTR